MSFLALAKQAVARLRAANGTTPTDAIDAVNAVLLIGHAAISLRPARDARLEEHLELG